LTRRALALVTVALVLSAAAAWILRPERGVPDGAPTEEQMGRAVGSSVLTLLARGHVPDRSGDVVVVPKPNHVVVGDWDPATFATATPTITTTHPNPWSDLVRVPIVFYDGDRRGGAAVDETPVDIADIAATYARVLGVEGFDGDGDPLPVELDRPPKAIVTVVIDGGGWNALQQHPASWPSLRSLAERGTTFTNATIGSAPAVTGAIHATFGTGIYPRTSGVGGHLIRGEGGALTDVYLENADPRYLDVPAVAELWDEQNANRPRVATVAFEDWHLGMIGHGAQRAGGDKDVAVFWEREEQRWWTNEDFFSLPAYVPSGLEALEAYEEELDERDGLGDGTWFGHTLDELRDPRVRPGSAAFLRFTGDVAIDVLRREKVGRDPIADMIWVQLKAPDLAGHSWNMLAPEQGDVLLEADRQLARIRDELDRLAGRGRYVLVVTADHGQQPLPDAVGGWRISAAELRRDIEERFGAVVEKITPAEIFLRRDADIEPRDIARYLATYTIADSIPESTGDVAIVEARLDDTVFAGAFSSAFLAGMDDEGSITRFGPGEYPEGRFELPQRQGG